MGTSGGASCTVNIDCYGDKTGGRGTNLPDWNVCYLGGRQYLTHPKLGDFSITWTKAGGVNGQFILSCPVSFSLLLFYLRLLMCSDYTLVWIGSG